MRIVAKAGRVGDLGQGLRRAENLDPAQEPSRVIETGLLYVAIAGQAAAGEQFLKIAQRNASFSGHVGRAEVDVGNMAFDDLAQSSKEPVGVRGGRMWISRREKRTKQIVDRQVHIDIGPCRFRSVCLAAACRHLEEKLRRQAVIAPVQFAGLEAQMGQERSAWQVKRKPVCVLAIAQERHGPRSVAKHDIARLQRDDVIVLGDRGPASNLEDREVVIMAVKSNVSRRPLDSLGIAGKIKRIQPA